MSDTQQTRRIDGEERELPRREPDVPGEDIDDEAYARWLGLLAASGRLGS
jgi:hypothetical protein